MHVHRHSVELLERGHSLEEEHNQPTALHRLDNPAQKVRRQRGEVLQHDHPVRRTQDLVRVLVVAVANVGRRDEEIERILLVWIVETTRDQLLHLPHPLLPMR